MRYHEPSSITEAVGLLAADPDARCLAGGQTLVAVINARLALPSALVALRRIPGLDAIRYEADGTLVVGATATHRALARREDLRGGHRLLSLAARRVAHPAIRTRGTIGGSICHGDPAADYPGVVTALDAEIEVAGAAGTRRVPAREFFTGFLATAVEPGELVTAVRIPPTPPDAVAVYEKHARCDGDFATVSLALVLSATARTCAVAVGSCGPTPVRSAAAEQALLAGAWNRDSVAAAGNQLVEAADPMDDVRGSAAYRRLLIPRLLQRAVSTARG